jgi:hypothetical protein
MRKRPLEIAPDKHTQHRDRKRRNQIPVDQITSHRPDDTAGPKRKARLHKSEGTSPRRSGAHHPATAARRGAYRVAASGWGGVVKSGKTRPTSAASQGGDQDRYMREGHDVCGRARQPIRCDQTGAGP